MKYFADLLKSRFWVLILFSLAIIFVSLPACAQSEAPTQSYTHQYTASGTKEAVSMRAVYSVSEQLDIRALGLSQGIEKLSDITCDSAGNLYILTSDGRLFVLDNHYCLIKEYSVTDLSGNPVEFLGAQGILAESTDEVYIADTENQRVIQIDGSGKTVREIIRPDSRLLPEDFNFAPVKVAKDSKGTLYVLCDGAYYGALLFNSAGEFGGFYGANTVKSSALTALSYIWDTLTKNDTKRAYSVKKLPYQFVDLDIDDKDFVYTCTGQTGSSASTGQIRKLSPSGTNILYKLNVDGTKTDSASFNFGEAVTEKRNNKAVVQNFVSVQADERGYIYSLDATYGIIYVYDTDCNLITAFGGGKGEGIQAGVFSAPVAMTYHNGRIMVADSQLNTVTVFELTDYGNMLLSAQQKTLSADYQGAKTEWEAVLACDSSSQLAMRGLAKAYYAEGDYETALQLAESGYDFVTYSQALERIQSAFITDHFIWIFMIGVFFVGVIIALAVISRKRRFVIIGNERVRLLFNAVIHPFDSFNRIKYQHKGSLVIAAVMTALFYISAVISETFSDFRFTSFNPDTSSSVLQLVKTVGLIVLFSLANWAVCVLMEGKGKLKDVYIVVAYATLPLAVYQFILTPLSHLIASSTSAWPTGLSTVAVILAGIMLTVGLMVIHEFSFPKFLGSMLLTVFAMLLIIFILFMLGMLLSQLWSFIVTVFMEVVYR